MRASSPNSAPAPPAADLLDVAGKDFWNSTWEDLPPLRPYDGPIFEQHAVLSKYLSRVEGASAIEIGCVPGNYMVYLNKEFGYRVDGIDYSEKLDYVRANLERNGIQDSRLFHADLFDFEPSDRYDLVFSGGVVEHFDDHELVIAKHAELAKPGGLVVIFVPNLTHIHWVLCRVFNPEILKVHRFPLMRRHILRQTLERAGLEVQHCEYHRTFRPPYRLPRTVDLASRALQKALRLARLDDFGNCVGSPYLISVSVKK